MKKAKTIIVMACILMQALWMPAAWSGQFAGAEISPYQSILLAGKDITPHEPKILVIEEGDIPKSAEKPERGWFSRNKWYILGGLVIVGGAAAAAGGGGSSSSGGGGGGSDVTVSW